jgi:hypothetical protein
VLAGVAQPFEDAGCNARRNLFQPPCQIAEQRLGQFVANGTGGFATAQARYLETPGLILPQDKFLRQHVGWSAGAGAEFALAPDWTARIEYLYDRFNRTSGTFPSGAAVTSDFDLHTLRLGLNHFFHPAEASAPPRADGKAASGVPAVASGSLGVGGSGSS